MKEAQLEKEKTQKILFSAQENIKALENQITLNLEDLDTLKLQLSSTSSQVRETELEYKTKLGVMENNNRTELARKDKEIEETLKRCKTEITRLNENHAESHEAQVQVIRNLSSEFEIFKSNFAKRGIEYEKMAIEVGEYREKVASTSERIAALEQRNKRLEKEKRALIAEVKRLQTSEDKFNAELTAEREAKEGWETMFKKLQEDNFRIAEKQKESDAERIKYLGLYKDAVKEKEATVDFYEGKMKEHNTKLKTSLDAGQGLMVTLNNMKLENLQKSTPGMNDIQRLKWANEQISETLMPTVRKQMVGQDERDDIAVLSAKVLSNLLLTLCENTLFSNNIQLKSATK